jgi:hypothetical protein
VPITKVAPNIIIYLHNQFQIFLILLTIFPGFNFDLCLRKKELKGKSKSIFRVVVGPPCSHPSLSCGSPVSSIPQSSVGHCSWCERMLSLGISVTSHLDSAACTSHVGCPPLVTCRARLLLSSSTSIRTRSCPTACSIVRHWPPVMVGSIGCARPPQVACL